MYCNPQTSYFVASSFCNCGMQKSCCIQNRDFPTVRPEYTRPFDGQSELIYTTCETRENQMHIENTEVVVTLTRKPSYRKDDGGWRFGYEEQRCWANCPCTQFQSFPTYVITIHQRRRRMDGQTDGRTTCDRNTALCTIVHRAVKTRVLPTFLPLIVCVCLHSNFSTELQKSYHLFNRERIDSTVQLQGHRNSICVPIKNAYATSQLSVVVLSYSVLIYGDLLQLKIAYHA